jgi:hypothetical protein
MKMATAFQTHAHPGWLQKMKISFEAHRFKTLAVVTASTL